MGLKLEVFEFSLNQNNHGSSCAYTTCIYCGLSVKINMRKTPLHMARKGCGRIRFACVVSKSPKTSNLSPHGWRRHYTGWYMKFGISLVYLYHTIGWQSGKQTDKKSYWIHTCTVQLLNNFCMYSCDVIKQNLLFVCLNFGFSYYLQFKEL